MTVRQGSQNELATCYCSPEVLDPRPIRGVCAQARTEKVIVAKNEPVDCRAKKAHARRNRPWKYAVFARCLALYVALFVKKGRERVAPNSNGDGTGNNK